MDGNELISEIDTGRPPMGHAALARRARDRLRAIKSFCKKVSSHGAGVSLERRQQALMRSSIYNAVTPALLALHDQLCELEVRTRRLALINLCLGVATAATVGAVILLLI